MSCRTDAKVLLVVLQGGKQTVECVNKALNTIPPGIDPGTQVLDITGNDLIILSHEKFKVSIRWWSW